MDLLNVLGNVKDEYVIRAEAFRKEGVRSDSKRHSYGRIIFVAATVALALLLVGCAIVCFFRMQDIKVGELFHYSITDEDGSELLPEDPGSITLLSLQGVHLEALSEWVLFLESYDVDMSIQLDDERACGAGNIPEHYAFTYGCYSQEMVDFLDLIVDKYDLDLLSSPIRFEIEQNRFVFDALQIDGTCLSDPFARVDVLDGYFYPEGTFQVDLSVSLVGQDWNCSDNLATYRYSRKDWFDPVVGYISDPESYDQWEYTRKDGIKVLLAMNKEYARMYADIPDAFISVSMEACEWEDGGMKIPMTRTALEQIAELLDLSIQPDQIGQDSLNELLEQLNVYPLQNDLDFLGYEDIVEDYISRIPNAENGSYLLHDLNGDGTDELMINGWGVYSLNEGSPYSFVDIEKLLTMFPQMCPCEGDVLEIYTDIEGIAEEQHYFYRAEEKGLTYLIGVAFNSGEGAWYLVPDDDPWTESDRRISDEEAQKILSAYIREDVAWCPVMRFGEESAAVRYSDPYANYIANKLVHYENADRFTYLLMDLNNDGVDELITRDKEVSYGGKEHLFLNVFTVNDGELVELSAGHTFAYILEGGILEETEELYGAKNAGGYWNYFRCTAEGVVSIEKVVRDPSTSVWGRVDPQNGGRDVSEEEAVSVIRKYSEMRMEPDMTPFADYPMK